MTKVSKSTSMIQRRKHKPTLEQLNKFREIQTKSGSLIGNVDTDKQDKSSLCLDDVLQSTLIRKIMISDKTLFLGLIVIRLVNAMLIQTYFVPDEFWQSLEVAHKMVFNYGYLTWEWSAGIRSYTYPLVFATLYRFLDIFGLDYRMLLIKAPRLLQGIFASIGDFFLFGLSQRLANREVAQWTVLCQILSWFTAYCCTRTLTNSTETVLVIAALYYFPWPGLPQPDINFSISTDIWLCEEKIALLSCVLIIQIPKIVICGLSSVPSKGLTWRFAWLAAASVVIRPTAAITWILLCSWHLQQCKGTVLWQTLHLYIIAGSSVLMLSTLVDRIWYGRWVFVHFNFLYFNVLSGDSAFYGIHPWHWYLSQGLPIILGSHLLPFLLGAWHSRNKVLLWLVLWNVTLLSFLSHKEIRFLMPVLPMTMHYCGQYLHSLFSPTHSKKSVTTGRNTVDKIEEKLLAAESVPSKKSIVVNQNDFPDPKQQKRDAGDGCRMQKAKFVLLLLAVTNIVPLLYFSLIHQRGTIDVMNYLQDAVLSAKNMPDGKVPDILFLMPCHSTPYYSFMHVNVSMRFLTCEPNLQHIKNYTDEAEVFFQDPRGWLLKEYQFTDRQFPTHIVYFSSLQVQINDVLVQNGFKQCAVFFHTHFPDGRVSSHVTVSCR